MWGLMIEFVFNCREIGNRWIASPSKGFIVCLTVSFYIRVSTSIKSGPLFGFVLRVSSLLCTIVVDIMNPGILEHMVRGSVHYLP